MNSSYIEISQSSYQQNLQFLRKVAGKHAEVSLVVKGNAYGHGIEVMVPLACEQGFSHFSVFNYEEALRVKNVAKEDSDVMIMGFFAKEDTENVIQRELSFFVFDMERLDEAVNASERVGKKARIHLEFDTGMNRTGFSPKKATELIEYVKKHEKYLSLEGVCSHLAGAESIGNYVRIKRQVKHYNRILNEFDAKGLTPKFKHLACSAAAIRYPSLRYDMLRLGILQYGFWPSREVFIEYLNKRKRKIDPLQRTLSWKTQVMTKQSVKGGEYVGYGTSYLANQEMQLAILPIGYGHGFSRLLSNQGRVILNNNRTNVVGMVNMNAITVDITNIPNINIGDEAILIGSSADTEISVSSFGEMSTQMNYELLTRLPLDIPRKIVA